MFNQKENALIDLLRQVNDVLDKQNIEFWLECGTLLGAVRDGKFIPWEHDIDLGAWREKVPENVKISVYKELCDRGFKVWIAENHMNIKKGEDFCADINFYRLNNNEAIMPKSEPINVEGKFLSLFLKVLSVPYHYKVLPGQNIFREANFKKKFVIFIRIVLITISRILPFLLRKQLTIILSQIYKKMKFKDVSWVVPSDYFTNLYTMEFYGIEFRVPAKKEEYLAYRYGEDWHTPRKNWVTNENDGTVSKK